MYRILIVDDEQIIADGLKELFVSNEEMELDVYTAYSSMEALGIMEEVRIDVVVSDIRMPGTSGIKLAQTIQQHWPLCKVIFLTGFKQPEYAIAAVKCRVVDYILKTENDEVIIQAVRKAIGQLEADSRPESLRPEAMCSDGIVEAALYNELLFSIDHSSSSEDLAQIFANTELDPQFPVIMVLAKLDGLKDVEQTVGQTRLMHRLILHHLSSRFQVLFVLRQGHICWLLQPRPEPEGLPSENYKKCIAYIRDTLEMVQETAAGNGTLASTFAVCADAIPVRDISRHYSILSRCLNKAAPETRGAVLTERTDEADGSMLREAYEQFSPVSGELEFQLPYLRQYLGEGKRAEFFELFDRMTTPILSVKHMNFSIAIELYTGIATELLHHINFNHLLEKIAFRINPLSLPDLSRFDTWRDAIAELRKTAAILFDIKSEEQQAFSSDIIRQVKEYIGLHLNQDLSLHILADKVGFNPFYLSRYFKNMEHKNLSTYIEEVKIDRAKSLLKNPGLKIMEIAKLLGFDSSSYFAIRFRKHTNMSPQEYRDSIGV